jgi:hypothetical protein
MKDVKLPLINCVCSSNLRLKKLWGLYLQSKGLVRECRRSFAGNMELLAKVR